jgi:hypothetical protein
VCRTAIPHSDPENNPVSEVIQSSSPVGKTDENSGSAISDFDIPWGTTEFLDLYPEPIDDGVSQVDSKSKDTAEADRREKGKSTS